MDWKSLQNARSLEYIHEFLRKKIRIEDFSLDIKSIKLINENIKIL